MKMRLIAALLIAMSATVVSADVYTVQHRGNLYSCQLDGSSSGQLATGGSSYRFTSVQTAGDYIYVGLGSYSTETAIYRYDLDGSNKTTFSTGSSLSNAGIGVTDSSIYYLSGLEFRSMDLDGTNDSLLYTLGSDSLIAYWSGSLSLVDSSAYWVADSRRFQTCELDGSNPTQIFQVGSSDSMTSAVTDGNYIYYALDATDTIYRRDMDGSNQITLLTDTGKATGVGSLQISDGMLYWSSDRIIYSMDLAGGSAVEQFNFDTVFATGSTRAIYFDIATIPEPTTAMLLGISALIALKRRKH